MKTWNKHLSKYFRKKGYQKEYLKLRVLEYKRSFKIRVVSVFMIIILFIIGIMLITYIPYYEKIEEKSINAYMSNIVHTYKSNYIVRSIAGVCSNLDKEERQIRCVNNFVKEFFYYDEHSDEIKLFRLPSEIINQGGCCRDYTLFYSAIFSVMGYESEFIHKPNHVYLRVFGEGNNYILDQQNGMVEDRL